MKDIWEKIPLTEVVIFKVPLPSVAGRAAEGLIYVVMPVNSFPVCPQASGVGTSVSLCEATELSDFGRC